MLTHKIVALLLVCYWSVAAVEENSCSKQRDKYFQCMRNLHTSTEAKLLKDKNQVVAQQCGISQINVQCWRIKDTCQNQAEQNAETSATKKEALEADDRCWKNIGSSFSQLYGSDFPGANGPAPAPAAGDPLSPSECTPAFDPQIATCTTNVVQQDQQFIAANEKLRQKYKQCQDQWPQQCKPQNPALVECLYKAYEKLTNLTMTNYRSCMEKSGYQLPGASGRFRQIFPL